MAPQKNPNSAKKKNVSMTTLSSNENDSDNDSNSNNSISEALILTFDPANPLYNPKLQKKPPPPVSPAISISDNPYAGLDFNPKSNIPNKYIPKPRSESEGQILTRPIFELDNNKIMPPEQSKNRKSVKDRIRNSKNAPPPLNAYVRPDVRVAMSKAAAMEGINSSTKDNDNNLHFDADNNDGGDQSSASPKKEKIAFGIQDALDFNTLTQLRKVFFQKEDSSSEEEEVGFGGDKSDNDNENDNENDDNDDNIVNDNSSNADSDGGGTEGKQDAEVEFSAYTPQSPIHRLNNTSPKVTSPMQKAKMEMAAITREENKKKNKHTIDFMLDEADEDDGVDDDFDGVWESRGLDLDEFIDEFGHIIGADLSRQQLQMMFMKIDANSDGDVSWDEFTNWLLKMEAGASHGDENEFGDLSCLHEQRGESKSFHSGMVGTLLSVKLPGHAYVTGGRDGTFRMWNSSTLEHIRTVSIVESNFHYTKLNADRKSIPGAKSFMKGGVAQVKTTKKRMWITDIVVMSLSNKLAVSSADRMITFFDLFTMEVSCRLRNLSHSPSSMTYHTNVTNSRQYLTFGDDAGFLHCLQLKPQFHFDEGLNSEGNDAFEYWKGKGVDLERQGLLSYYSNKLHKDWITHVTHIGDLQPNILTCR